jgi:hypothetical protein
VRFGQGVRSPAGSDCSDMGHFLNSSWLCRVPRRTLRAWASEN